MIKSEWDQERNNMAGGTHIFDMIKRLRENENLRKKRYFQKHKGEVVSRPLHDKVEASEEERGRDTPRCNGSK